MSRPILALDSVSFRYADDEVFRALRFAGYDLRVSSIALAETWASAFAALSDPDKADDPEDGLRLLSAAARRLRDHSREPTPVEPFLTTYILERGGQLPPHLDGQTLGQHRAGYSAAWEIATREPFTRADLAKGDYLVDDVRETRGNWAHFCRVLLDRVMTPEQRASLLGPDDPSNPPESGLHDDGKRERRRLRQEHERGLIGGLQALIAEKIVESGMTETWVDGLHAFTRMMAYQSIRYGLGREQVERNDGTDAHQLAHLAQGAIMVTRDRRFLRRLDRIGTHLAPWACSEEQLLRAPPFGLPNHPAARERAATFVRLFTDPIPGTGAKTKGSRLNN